MGKYTLQDLGKPPSFHVSEWTNSMSISNICAALREILTGSLPIVYTLYTCLAYTLPD